MSRFLTIVGRVLAGLLGLLVLLYVGNALLAVLDAQQNKRQARADAEEGLPRAQHASLAYTERMREELGLGEPAHAWSVLSCAVETNEGGWIVLDHVNTCTLTRTELFPVGVAPDAGCVEVLSLEDAPWPYPQARRGSAPACKLAGDEGARLVSGERPDGLDATRRWVVIEAPVEVSRTVVGCHRWSVIFCDEPGGLPVMPED